MLRRREMIFCTEFDDGRAADLSVAAILELRQETLVDRDQALGAVSGQFDATPDAVSCSGRDRVVRAAPRRGGRLAGHHSAVPASDGFSKPHIDVVFADRLAGSGVVGDKGFTFGPRQPVGGGADGRPR